MRMIADVLNDATTVVRVVVVAFVVQAVIDVVARTE